ncbi:hypothetical protein EGW08_009455, partial [Elysia chlorotica]
HLFSLPLHANPKRLDPIICRDWIAVPLDKTVIGLWNISDFNTGHFKAKPPPIELNGHEKEITALSFSSSKTLSLASASKDKLLLWKLKTESFQEIKSEVFYSSPGEVSCLCFNNKDNVIAIGIETQIQLLTRQSNKPVAILDAHRSMVTGIKYCPHYSSTLVSISDDRTFCVWDVSGMSLLYQSSILSPAPLISLSMNFINSHVAIGSADGSLKIFDLTDGHDFRALADIDIALLVKKELSSRPQLETDSGSTVVHKFGRKPIQGSGNDEISAHVQSSESILSIQYAYFIQDQNDSTGWIPSPGIPGISSGASDIMTEKSPSICIVTSNTCVQLDARSLQVLQCIDMHRSIKSCSFSESKTIGSIAFAGIDQNGPQQMIAAVGALFEKRIDVITWPLCETNGMKLGQCSADIDSLNIEDISIIPTSALSDKSPLKSEILPSLTVKAITKGDIATGKKKLTAMSQPLTFKSKIKSSGYTQAPRMTMFKPETSKTKLLGMEKVSLTTSARQKPALSRILKGNYDAQAGPPIELCDSLITEHQATAVINLKFAGDGSGLACAMSNKTGLVLKAPFSKQIFCSFTGHDGGINTMQWSNDSSLLITASKDKKAFLWSKTGGDPLLILNHTKGSLPQIDTFRNANQTGLTKSKSSENKTFDKEIKHCQFFFMDKFILLIHGSILSLYKYSLSPERDEIKRYASGNRYKLVTSWESDSSCFTASAAVNSFMSYLAVCATSARNLEVYDLNRSVLAHSFTDCHTRPAHSIAINEGSRYAPQPSEAHNVIATSAQTDPIKLWDLRSKNNIQTLQGHLNSAHACQIAFSPCGNYLATGSENKMAYLYDLRKGTYIERLRGHTEAVTSVAFHPAYPLLATGSLDSKIKFYKS